MIELAFGNLRLALSFPAGAPVETLPGYIQPFGGAVLPEAELRVHFHPPADEPGGHALPERSHLAGAWRREGDDWHFSVKMPLGPHRPDQLAVRLVIPALHFILPHYGVAPLHAAGVHDGGQAILFVGRSGSGKSTLARRFASRPGWRFFCDDRALIWRTADGWRVVPSCERPNPFQSWNRRDPLRDAPPPASPEPPYGLGLPIGAILFPEVRPDAETRERPLSPAESLARLAVCGWSDAAPSRLPPGRALTLGREADSMLVHLSRRLQVHDAGS